MTDWAIFEAEAMPHVSEIFRIAMTLVRNRTEAEDLVQETFTEALKSFHRFQSGTNCRAWLITILYHTHRKRRRGDKRRRFRFQLMSEVEDGSVERAVYAPPPSQDFDYEVLRALAAVEQKYRDVVLLADVEEMSYKEIAEALAIPLGTVMSRLSRGRRLLREQLDEYKTTNSNGRVTGEAIGDEQAKASSDGHAKVKEAEGEPLIEQPRKGKWRRSHEV